MIRGGSGCAVVRIGIFRAGDWKLIKRYEGKPFELFNLKDDMSESIDLAEKLPEKVKALDTRLQQDLRRINAKMPKPNPGCTPRT